jgi:hypothetical protein
MRMGEGGEGGVMCKWASLQLATDLCTCQLADGIFYGAIFVEEAVLAALLCLLFLLCVYNILQSL